MMVKMPGKVQAIMGVRDVRGGCDSAKYSFQHPKHRYQLVVDSTLRQLSP